MASVWPCQHSLLGSAGCSQSQVQPAKSGHHPLLQLVHRDHRIYLSRRGAPVGSRGCCRCWFRTFQQTAAGFSPRSQSARFMSPRITQIRSGGCKVSRCSITICASFQVAVCNLASLVSWWTGQLKDPHPWGEGNDERSYPTRSYPLIPYIVSIFRALNKEVETLIPTSWWWFSVFFFFWFCNWQLTIVNINTMLFIYFQGELLQFLWQDGTTPWQCRPCPPSRKPSAMILSSSTRWPKWWHATSTRPGFCQHRSAWRSMVMPRYHIYGRWYHFIPISYHIISMAAVPAFELPKQNGAVV